MSMWYSKKVNQKAIEFCSYLDNELQEPYDNSLIPYEIKADKVYAEQLCKKGYITKKSFEKIRLGLDVLMAKYHTGKLGVENYEDVHSMVESELKKIAGKSADNLYLGKSRNDQSATILRMYTRNNAAKIQENMALFSSLLKSEDEKKGKTIIPGYSHNRIAMPSDYSTLLGEYISNFRRDDDALEYWIAQYNECSLGAAAGFGTKLKINIEEIAKQLEFERIAENTLDAVMKIDAEKAFVFAASNIYSHLSKIADDFILLSMEGVDVIQLPKKYCMGSSIMPQKQNPDVLETIKEKSARINGNLCTLLQLNKGNMSGYNREMQTAKYCVIDTVREFYDVFDVLGDLIKGAIINGKQSKKLLARANAYSAEKIISECAKNRTGYRTKKLKFERKLKEK